MSATVIGLSIVQDDMRHAAQQRSQNDDNCKPFSHCGKGTMFHDNWPFLSESIDPDVYNSILPMELDILFHIRMQALGYRADINNPL